MYTVQGLCNSTTGLLGLVVPQGGTFGFALSFCCMHGAVQRASLAVFHEQFRRVYRLALLDRFCCLQALECCRLQAAEKKQRDRLEILFL